MCQLLGLLVILGAPKHLLPPPEKKSKKDKMPAKSKKSVESTSADTKISELDQKWLQRFNRLETLHMSKSFQPTFSSDIRVTPTHSPPATVSKDSEPFFQPTHWPVDTSPVKRTGPDAYASQHQSAGKLQPDKVSQGQVPAERTGPDAYASQHQSAGNLKSEPHRLKPSTSGCTGPDIALKHQSTGKPASDRHRPDSLPSDSDPATTGHQSSSKLSTDRPLSN